MKPKHKLSLFTFMFFVALFFFTCSKEETNVVLTPPVATSIEIFDIKVNTAKSISNVTLNEEGELLSKGICFGTTPDPTVSGNKTNDGTEVGDYISYIENLEANKEYYVRAYATNEAGTSYGKNLTLKTSAKPIIKGNLTLETQEELDFLFKSGITMVDGNLTIGTSYYNNEKKIISLEMMHTLTEVKGDLIIKRTLLENLSGLEGLIKVGGDFSLSHNDDLLNLNALKKYQSNRRRS